MNDTMKNTIRKPKKYFYLALGGFAESIVLIITFIVQAKTIDRENIFGVIFMSPMLIVSTHYILLHFKWKIVFEEDKIIVHKPFRFPKVYPKEEVFYSTGDFFFGIYIFMVSW